MSTRRLPASFAQLLISHRRAAGLTQEELAERAHLSVGGISNLERGIRRMPQRETVELLAAALALPEVERAAFTAAARGLGEPEAAAQPHGAVPTNLPLALTSFVGRAQELLTVRGLLGETRLLTLTGAGGCGKTRLALEVARALLRDAPQEIAYAEGIWLVELAALSDGAHVAQAVASVLGVREQAGSALLDRLTAFLQPKQLLLILDNCEHLVGACAELVDALLRVCPRLTILASSREALGIAGEWPWRVPSLGIPDLREPLTREQTLASEAVQLFVQRALLVRQAGTSSAQHVELVGRICARLDGIPLAIELAAARLSALSLDHLAARLDDRFRVLTGGSRTALPRQQTLRATLDWSYDLLSASERLLLRRLSVFSGGWTLEAAEAICAGDSIAPEDILDLLTGLVNKSLVLLVEGGTGARYQVLETVRQYGHEKLVAAEAAHLRKRHLEWYLTLAGQAAERIGGAEREVWLALLEVEFENMRGALQWSSLEGWPQAGLQLAAALEDFWYIRGYAGEGRRWLETLLERSGPAVTPDLRARAVEVLAMLTYYQGENMYAMRLFETAHALHSSAGNVASATWALTHQGMVAITVGEDQRATMLLEQVLPIHREEGDLHGVGWALSCLAEIRHHQGEYAAAAALYEASLAVFQELGDTYGSAHQLYLLGNLGRDQGDYARARPLYRESLRQRRSLMDKSGIPGSIEGLATVAIAEGQPVRAARLFGTAHGLREAIGTPIDLAERTAHDRRVASVRSALGEEAFATAWAAGEAMALEGAIELALAETSAVE